MAVAAVQNSASSADGVGALGNVPAHNSSLYVGDLDRDVTEAELFDLFSQVGPVASIRVCRDAVTRRSLGYAYVNYNSSLDPQAAERALETLNYTPMNGRPMRIMWSHRDPAFRKSGVGNIFIKNLDKTIDNKALHDTFSAFGNILSCKVAMDSSGVSKGYGFVHFESEESAKLAVEKVNGMLLEGKMVYVGPFKPRTDRADGKDVKFTNVYVKNLDLGVSEEELRKMFEKFGPVTSCVIMKDNEGKSKGFGFVNFDMTEDANNAVEELNGTDVNGKELYCGRAQKKSEREAMLKQKFEEVRQERIAKYQGMNLYVKNLVDDIDDEKLRSEFAQYGTITSAKVMRDSNGKSKGFGFVCYSSPEEATKAVTEMNGRMFGGKPMYVALAQRKEVRRAQLEQQYQQRVPPMPGRPGAPGGPMPAMPPYGAAPPMFYAGPGAMPPARPGAPNMMYPQVMPRGMPQSGRGPRGMVMNQHQPGMVMGGRGGRQSGGRGRGGRPDGMKARGQSAQWVPQTRAPRPAPVPPPQPAPPVTPAPAAPSGVVPGQEGSQLTTAMLAAAPPEQQKQMLGERLFPLVQSLQPELAGKITGMLLEMDNSELLLLLESPEALDSKVEEAIQVLKQHNAIPEEGQ